MLIAYYECRFFSQLSNSRGRVYCRLWDKEIDIDLYDDVPLEYAHKCAEAMNSMPDDLIDKICRAAKKYCLDFLDTAAEKSTLISMF